MLQFFVRWVVTVLGAGLLTHAALTADQVNQLIGALTVIVTLVWGIASHSIAGSKLADATAAAADTAQAKVNQDFGVKNNGQ